MIDVASLACRSCITVYARRRLCAGCSLPKSTTARSQHSRLGRIVRLYGQQPAAKTRHNTGPHSTLACSTSPRRRLSISYRFVASAADVGGQQIVTQHMANWAQSWVAACRTVGRRSYAIFSWESREICKRRFSKGNFNLARFFKIEQVAVR